MAGSLQVLQNRHTAVYAMIDRPHHVRKPAVEQVSLLSHPPKASSLTAVMVEWLDVPNTDEVIGMSGSDRYSRRGFLGKTVAAGATGMTVSRALAQTAKTSANDRIHVGLIGAGGQAQYHVGQLQAQPDCVITAVCDVWQERLDRTIAKCEGAKPYHDYRDLLADTNVDAVLIASPPHWHALQAIHACEAGKDLYVEKPMSLSIGESFALLNAVNQHKRISQVGTQIHAGKPYHQAVDIIRSGVLGPINVARTFHVLNQGPNGIGNPPVGECPKGLDWDFWCGPRSLVPYHPLLAKDSYHHPSFMEHTGGWYPVND